MQLLLNLLGHRFIGSGGRGGGNMGDEVGKRWLTGFSEMDLIPGLQGSTLFTPMSIRIVRRVDEQCGDREDFPFLASKAARLLQRSSFGARSAVRLEWQEAP